MSTKIIQGNNHTDHRGTVSFVNDFDMNPVRRFYTICHPDTSIVRAWQGHMVESKYFHVIRGSFKMAVIKPDNWESPSKELPREIYKLTDKNSEILQVPGGYITGFKAQEPDSIMIVFSDKSLSESIDDDYRFPLDYWLFE